MEKREHLGLLQNRAAEFAIKSDQLRDQIQVRKTELGSLEQQLTQIERGKAELSGGIAVLMEQVQQEQAEAEAKSTPRADGVETIADRKAARAAKA